MDEVHPIVRDPEASDGIGVLLHEARPEIGPLRVVAPDEALPAHQQEEVIVPPQVAAGDGHPCIGDLAEVRCERCARLDGRDGVGHMHGRQPVVRDVVPGRGAVRVAAHDVEHAVALRGFHVGALQLLEQSGGQGAQRRAPHLARGRRHHPRGAVVVARQEGDRRLAPVQPVRAAAQQQPLPVVRAPGEGLQARHAGQGHFLQHERSAADHLRPGGPGQGSGEQQQDQGNGGGAGIHAAKLSAARAPGR